MPVLAPGEAARATRRAIVSNGVDAHLTTFIGANRYMASAEPPPGPEAVYPMAFLVEQPAGSVVASHFHEANQFQLVVAGSGTLGTHAVQPIAVHYSNAYSAYGPITAGDEGLQYLTLRNGYDRGARYLPAAREELRGVQRRFREAVADARRPATAAGGGHDGNAAGGDAGWARRLAAPAAARRGAAGARPGGRGWAVLGGHGGELRAADGATLPALSCAFVGPEEPPFAVTAGEAGLEVVVMQYPRGRDHVAVG